jgi:hypothetical protein
MKAVILGAISFGAFSALAQNTVVVIPAFENRFAGPHQTVVTVRSDDSRRTASALIPSRAAGGSSGLVTSDGRRVQALDAATMNIPVFPGPAFGTPDAATVTVFQQGFGFTPITNVFGQVIGAAGTIPALPSRTTGTGAATNAVPAPASPPLTSPEFNENLGRPPVQPGAAVTQPGAPVPPPLSPTFGQPAGAPVPPAPRAPSASGASDTTPAPAAPRPTP